MRYVVLGLCLAFASVAVAAEEPTPVDQFFARECPTRERPPRIFSNGPNFVDPPGVGNSLPSECGALFDIAADGTTTNIRALCTGFRFDETLTEKWSAAMHDYVAATNYGTMAASFDHQAHSCVATTMRFLIVSPPKRTPPQPER